MESAENLRWGFVPKKITKNYAEGSGMALTLITLLAGYFTHQEIYYKLAIPVVLTVMTVPMLFYPLAVVWFSISNLLGLIMPRIIFTVIYLTILLPVAVIRKWNGYDPLLKRKWKKGTQSVMQERDHLFLPTDLEKPY